MDSFETDIIITPFVSVIVPVYNVEQFLDQSVNSLVHQTLKQIEIILIDDGSTDNCPAMCDAFAEKDERVSVIHLPNGGYGKACNTGMDAARGKYIAILEPDDYAEPEMYEKLYNSAASNELDVARCHYYFYNSGNNTNERVDLPYIPQGKVFSPRDVHNVFYQAPAIWAAVYRRNFIRDNAIFFLETPGASYQDTSFIYKVYACAERFMLVEDTLIHYRVDNENSSSNSAKNAFVICKEYEEIRRFTLDEKIDVNWRHIVPKMKFGNYMWNYRRLNKNNNWSFLKVFSREMRRYLSQGRITVKNFSYKEIAKIYAIAFMFPLFHLLFIVSRKASD